MVDRPALRIAVTRDVSPRIVECELTHVERRSINVGLAREQHLAYERCLESLGCRVVRATPTPKLADSVFVEDTAVVLDGSAVITRPGALSRRAETETVAEVLGRYLPLRRITAPATLDGGDVLRVGRVLYVGRTGRTNEGGIEQLAATAEPLGYSVTAVPVSGCLHLKTAVAEVVDGVLIANPDWVDPSCFPGCTVLSVDAAEPFAANALRIGDRVLYPSTYPATRRVLEAEGVRLTLVDLSELAKAEGAVTCCSLVVESFELSTVGTGRSAA